MSVHSGYGSSAKEDTLGTFPYVQSVTVGPATTDQIVVKHVTDEDKYGTKLPLGNTGGDVTIKMSYNATTAALYADLLAMMDGHTVGDWEFEDVLGASHSGEGRVTSCGNIPQDTTQEMSIEVVVSPLTKWTYAAPEGSSV
jgi:hypothetical protein